MRGRCPHSPTISTRPISSSCWTSAPAPSARGRATSPPRRCAARAVCLLSACARRSRPWRRCTRARRMSPRRCGRSARPTLIWHVPHLNMARAPP
eukprot:6362381-Prymnesium_polylepis.1